MLVTKNLAYTYQGAAGALQFPDIQCATGEQWLLLGQSGSGKTTLLHLLAGLRTPQSGSIQVNDTVLNQLPSRELDHFRGRNIGVIFQEAHFVRALTVAENLLLAQKLAGNQADMKAVEEILDHLNVAHKLHARSRELSVGEQQRVNIARAMINKPSIILADEPTSALDDANTAQVVDLLRREAGEAQATLLIVTHDNRLKTIFEKQIEL
ncbi:MAG TPA: ATP-binding cassette domain-containing protein [Saprospiraceae bacterium]|nr:ATP-binding cassette domain-containing protein [Saprospiraceae bacterium]